MGDFIVTGYDSESLAPIERTLAEVAEVSSPELQVTKSTLYRYETRWAEESGRLSSGQYQYSYGNGATGGTGIQVPPGKWVISELFFNADTFGVRDSCEISIRDIRETGPSSGATVVAAVSLPNPVVPLDFNAPSLYVDLASDFAKNLGLDVFEVPENAVLAIRTDSSTGGISDVRVGYVLRKVEGEYVSDVKIAGP